MFDLYQLDKYDDYDDETEAALHNYLDDLLELFAKAPEGQEHQKIYPEMGFWVAQLIKYGYDYVGATIPQMTVRNVEEIITELFPRKISLSSPDDAKETLPELIAFWNYLGREYKLPNANAILNYLNGITESKFVSTMNNPSLFGMAKSFFMGGQSAGFDMSRPDEMNTFMSLYNNAQLGADQKLLNLPAKIPNAVKQDKAKEKRKRKAAKVARKNSRK